MAGSVQSNSQGSPGSSPLSGPILPHSNIVLVVGLVAVLATLIVPLPTPLLDMFLACSISLSIAVLVVTLSSKECSNYPRSLRCFFS